MDHTKQDLEIERTAKWWEARPRNFATFLTSRLLQCQEAWQECSGCNQDCPLAERRNTR